MDVYVIGQCSIGKEEISKFLLDQNSTNDDGSKIGCVGEGSYANCLDFFLHSARSKGELFNKI